MEKSLGIGNMEELDLELKDNEWPMNGIDTERVVARGIVTDREGYFYFVRAVRDDAFCKGTHIETAGGGVDAGEELPAALRRELKEELGAEVDILGKIGVVRDDYNLIRRHNITHYYLCRALSFGETRMTRDEIDRYHLTVARLSYEEALAEYERGTALPLGRLLAAREVPVLKRAMEMLRANPSA